MAAPSFFEPNPEIARLFPELHPPLPKQAALAEANRCLNCFDAPCTSACPTQIDVPRFIKKIASGNTRGAAISILDANVLASSCARVCPVEVLCEGSCVMHYQRQPAIAIGQLQRYAMDAFDATGARLPAKTTVQRRQRIACLGAGPASLAAAAELRQQGFEVVVFDRKALPGGLNTYGVAEYKLSTSNSLREIARIAELGVEFRLGVELNQEAELQTIEDDFDAVFIGIGLGATHTLAIPGTEHPAVIEALKFIEGYKTGQRTEAAQRVIVIGAGNTAVDAAIAARLLGATEVRVLYRRTRDQISAFAFEYEHALQQGVRFDWLTQPIAIYADQGDLKSIECVTMQLDPHTASVTPVEGSNFHIPCDLVIPAIGQVSLLDLLSKFHGVALKEGRVQINRVTGQTTSAKYSAGGDCVNGGREVVDAVADGKRAALAIARSLGSA